MFNDDRFEFGLAFGGWLLTVALGIGLGLVAVGAVSARRSGAGERREGAALTVFGALLVIATVLAVYDGGRFAPVYFRLRPYLSHVAEAAALASAAVLGAGFAATVALVMRRGPQRGWAVPITGAVCFAAVVLLLWRVDVYETRGRVRHPIGTQSELVQATRVIEGLAVPTGLAIAANGDLAVIELAGGGVRVYSTQDGRFIEFAGGRPPIPAELQGFHIAFHPDWPAQPYLYATTETGDAANRAMQLVRVRVDGASLDFEPIVGGLPIALTEETGNHYGSAVMFCDSYFYLTTGDTEANSNLGQRLDAPNVVRDEAQDLTSLRGKVLRWRLDGTELSPAPAGGTALPIYAYGFRNPFGMACDPRSGFPVVAENGPLKHDQVRLVPPGSNHEWPLSDARDTLRRPLLDTGPVQIAPTGLASRTSGTGVELLMTAFVSEGLYLLPVAEDGQPGTLRLVREVDGGAFAVATDAAGCVYFSDAVAIWRLEDGRCAR